MTGRDHLRALIRAFAVPERRGRYLALTETKKGLFKLLGEFYHPPWRPEVMEEVAFEAGNQDVVRRLRALGAPEQCWVWSPVLDAGAQALEMALATVRDAGHCAVLSCIPGRLAYYEGEEGAAILHRRDR